MTFLNFGAVSVGGELVQASLDGSVDEFRKVGLPVHEIETVAAEADTLGFRHALGAAVVGATDRRTRKVREAARAAMPRRTLSGRSSSWFSPRFVCTWRLLQGQ